MDSRLLAFLGGGRKVDAGRLTLRVLSAQQLLQARQEAQNMNGSPEELGVRLNACVIARAAERHGRKIFRDGTQTLQRLSAEEIAALAARYQALCSREAPGFDAWREIKRALADSPAARLRWRVQRSFLALPTERRVREMTDADYVYCAANLLLDKEERLEQLCPECREAARRKVCPVCGRVRKEERESAENSGFDAARFEELKEHGGA